jgi:TonB-linked SusC/RagA family outer membrane protein
MTSNLRRLLAGAAVMLGVLPAIAAAQQSTTIRGRVVTEAGTPIQSANVSIAAMGVGAYSQADGSFTLNVPAQFMGQSADVVVRRIGFTQQTKQVQLTGATVSQDFVLTAVPTVLTGVVTTALGAQVQKSTLGTAQQQLTTADITTTPSNNVVTAIQGKVSGVQITGSGTQGGSTRIVIRGANSISGNNEPLFVVDGVLISNHDRGAGPMGGFDFGSAINDLNPADIATMSVLKGPNAAALYGSQAANGVVLITTKSGHVSGGGIHTEANTFFTWDKPSILPNYQNQYGQGAGGAFQYVDGAGGGTNDGADQSWGPMLDGRMIEQFTCPNSTCPWVAHPNNVKSFFPTGHNMTANFAITGGTDNANARLSVGTDQTQGIIPGNYLQKNTAMLTGRLQVNPKFSTDASLQYVRDQGQNRPGQGYSNSILESFVWFGRQVDMGVLKNSWQKDATLNNGPAGREYNWNYNYHNNPYFLMYGNPENDTRDRLIGSVSATYKFLDWLSLTGRAGGDVYNMNISQDYSVADITGVNMDYSTQGAFGRTNDYINNRNSDLILDANHDIGTHVSFNGMVGGTIRQQHLNSSNVYVRGITAAGIYNVSNAAIAPSLGQSVSNSQVNSSYGSAAFTWNGWWTVEGTARQDWSSTLPKGNNSYFYPSGNTSVVLTDAFPSLRTNWLSYLKLRGSIAQVGNDASPYQLASTFNGSSSKYSGQPLYSLSQTLANSDLKPEITKSGEVGVEASFFSGRANLDATWYQKATRNQIFDVTVSTASGFAKKAINAGRIFNHGIEALLTVIPVQLNNGFQWSSTLNFSRNRSMVDQLYAGVTAINLSGNEWYTYVQARQGQPYGALYGNGFARDSATGQLLTDGGLTMNGGQKVLGNVQPDWVGGWSNSINYKNWSFSGLVDAHVGGDIFSITNWFGEYAGVLQSSLRGREADWNSPGIVVQGIDVNTGQPNTTNVTAEEYFQNVFPVNEPNVYKDTYFKLRELRIGYDLPARWAQRFNASAVSVAVIGSNLHVWTNVPNIDPEFAYSTGNAQGIEYASIPSPRSWGVSVRIIP